MPRVEDYKHLPVQNVLLEWEAEANKPDCTGNRVMGQHYRLALDLAIHPNQSRRIIINYPGLRGEKDGYMDKHRKLAQIMQGENLGAVVRGKGPGHPDFNGFSFDVQLRKMIEFSVEYAKALSGSSSPEIMLIGTSAGGGVAAAIAHEYEEISRILLMAPGNNIGLKQIRYGLANFSGEVTIVIGKDDTNVGAVSGWKYLELSTGASRRKLFNLSNCGHNFEGEQNGRIMSQAPFYAFAEGKRPKFPNLEGGIALY